MTITAIRNKTARPASERSRQAYKTSDGILRPRRSLDLAARGVLALLPLLATVLGCQNRGAPTSPRGGTAIVRDSASSGAEGGRAPGLMAAADKARTSRADLKVRGLLESACTAGDVRGCLWLANDEFEGAVGAKKPEAAHSRARSKYGAGTEACQSGDMDMCIAVAEVLEDGIGAEMDEKAATALYERACAARNGEGCWKGGLMYTTARGVPRDDAKAQTLYETGCKLADTTSCRMAARSPRNFGHVASAP